MFLDEARVAATLHHQHIVQVHDVGESSGEYFIAMEYLHGEDVRTLLSNASKSRAHVPIAIAVAIVSAAAAGLHYAHERRGADGRPLDIIHRDVSPSNILVGYDGSVKIVDFGIAKAAIREETRSGGLKGKVSYMSPEQCTGAPLDRRSDVYALGVVLYELATTTRLFRGESDYRLMEQIVKGQVTLPRVRRPDLPDELSAIIMRALAADREQRFATADDLRVALERFATKTGAIASTSTVAAYMRKQFGDRPEPWVELAGQFEDSFDDDRRDRDRTPGSSGSGPRASWTELPRSQELFRSSSSIPMQTAPRVGDGAPHVSPAAHRPTSARPGTPPNTSAELAWQQPPAPAPVRRSGAARAAMIAAPVLLLASVGVWKLTSTSEPATASLTAATAPATPAPMVTPIPDAAAAPAPAAAAAPKVAHAEEPPARARPASATAKRGAEPAAPAKARTVERSEPAPSPPPASAARLVTPTPAPVAVAITPTSAPSAPVGPQPMVGPAAPPPPPTAPRAGAPGASAGSGSAGSAAPTAIAAAAAAPAPAPAAAAPSPAITTSALPSPSAAPAAPQNVAQTVLDANRIAGDKSIVPDDTTQADIRRSGIAKVIGAYKVCLGVDGGVDSITQIKSTGFSAYDQKIQNTIRSKWRYKPFMVNGKAAPVCTAVRFIFSNG